MNLCSGRMKYARSSAAVCVLGRVAPSPGSWPLWCGPVAVLLWSSSGGLSAPAVALQLLPQPGRQALAQTVQQLQQFHVVLAVVLRQEGPSLRERRSAAGHHHNHAQSGTTKTAQRITMTPFWANVRANVRANIPANARANLRAKARANARANVRANVRARRH